jgi:hypothetical protein
MATHGTIRLTSKVEKGTVLLQTPHDGHAGRAVKLLTGQRHDVRDVGLGDHLDGLPLWLAKQKRYRADLIADRFLHPTQYRPAEEPTLESLQDLERSHSTVELCLMELAAWIVAADPCVYRVIPPLFQAGYLADYDRDETLHLHMVILDGSSFQIKASKAIGIAKPITVDLISEIHKHHLRMAQETIANAKRIDEIKNHQ